MWNIGAVSGWSFIFLHNLLQNTRTTSLSSNPNRPTPQQERAARTHQLFLDTAERLFVELGYDAMTMTAVAERAGTSIGALYRWFPDKTAVAAVLLARYTVEIEQHWASLIAGAHTLTTAKFAESLISRTREFSQRRPAYFILRDAPIKVSRSAAARQILREAFVQTFQEKNRQFHTRKRFSLPTLSWKR
jgi:AcrR family transcriptional regulator